MKKIYEFGLRNCEDSPQVYKLSEILAGYQQGFKDSGMNLTQIGVKDDNVKSDGSWDFYVPRRYSKQWGLKHRITGMIKNIQLSWYVISGKASVLFYK